MADTGTALQPAPPAISAWSSRQHPRRERYDAWAQTLGEYFLPWSVDSAAVDGFQAQVRQRRIGALRFLRCRSEPLSGHRSGAELGRTQGEFYNILFIASGSERLRIDNRETLLGTGQFVLWDSARAMRFEVLQPLDKLTLMVPARSLRAVLPNAADYVGVALGAGSGLGGLFGTHMRSLNRALWSLADDEAAGVVAPTLELFAQACMSAPGRPRPASRTLLMQRIFDYARMHLADPALTPARIAAAQRISLRHLHGLFAEHGSGVAEWIREQRLERCRRALANPAHAQRSITEIALGWGFADPGHFARLFRSRYGHSPRAFRSDAGAAGTGHTG